MPQAPQDRVAEDRGRWLMSLTALAVSLATIGKLDSDADASATTSSDTPHAEKTKE